MVVFENQKIHYVFVFILGSAYPHPHGVRLRNCPHPNGVRLRNCPHPNGVRIRNCPHHSNI